MLEPLNAWPVVLLRCGILRTEQASAQHFPDARVTQGSCSNADSHSLGLEFRLGFCVTTSSHVALTVLVVPRPRFE